MKIRFKFYVLSFKNGSELLNILNCLVPHFVGRRKVRRPVKVARAGPVKSIAYFTGQELAGAVFGGGSGSWVGKKKP